MPISEVIKDLSTWLVTLGVTSAVGGLAAYKLFQGYSTEWLKSHFENEREKFKAASDRDLEEIKRDHQQEIERSKGEISRFMDRATRFHQREYEVLPESWKLLNVAYSAGMRSVSVVSYGPDLDSMGAAAVEEVLAGSSFTDTEKDRIRSSTDKNKAFGDVRNWKLLVEAQAATSECSNYVLLHAPFIHPDIEILMRSATDALHSAMGDREFAERYPQEQGPYWLSAGDKVKSVAAMVEKVKEAVQARLWEIQPA